MIHRFGALVALSVLATCAFAQGNFVDPNLMEGPDGTYLGICWNLRTFRPGEPIKLDVPPATRLTMLVGLYGNNPTLQQIKK